MPAPTTVGGHIRKARYDRGLTQARAAVAMAVSAATVLNWEKGATEPPSAFWPAIIAFLGYDPHPPPDTLPERMAAFRRRQGLSIKEAARRADLDEASWARWERTGRVRPKAASKILRMLETPAANKT